MIIIPEWLIVLLQYLAIMGFLWSLGPLIHWWITRNERKPK